MTRRCAHCRKKGHNCRTCPTRGGGAGSAGCGGGGGDGRIAKKSAANRRAERKKVHPWCDVEHRLFLLGLDKYGKGDWRGISREFVTSRTPWEVACHAKEYFSAQEREESHDKCYSEKEEPLHLIPNMNLRIRAVLKLPVYPWRDTEHQLFLLGLKRLGKGDWFGISAKYVTTRTPREVARHAEEYFTTQEKEESHDKCYSEREESCHSRLKQV